VRRAAAAVAEAAGRGADILVLPEYGLSGLNPFAPRCPPPCRDAWVPYLEQLPAVGEAGAVPCDAPGGYALAP
jgi:predicted amidohydrolase